MGRFSQRFVWYIDIKGEHTNTISHLFLLRRAAVVIPVPFFRPAHIAFARLAVHTMFGSMTLKNVQYYSCDHFIKKSYFCQEKIKNILFFVSK